MATKIIINRKSESLNRLRGFKVFIDDKEVGAVKNGSSEEFVVEPRRAFYLFEICLLQNPTNGCYNQSR